MYLSHTSDVSRVLFIIDLVSFQHARIECSVDWIRGINQRWDTSGDEGFSDRFWTGGISDFGSIDISIVNLLETEIRGYAETAKTLSYKAEFGIFGCDREFLTDKLAVMHNVIRPKMRQIFKFGIVRLEFCERFSRNRRR